MTAPDASILIPTYCRPHYLREALASALEQTHFNIEVLVGDDGSLARPVVEEMGDARVRLLDHRERLGMAGNWNALLDAAQSPVLALLMDDDRLLPTFVEKCLAIMHGDPSIGVTFTNHFWEKDGVRRLRACDIAPGPKDRFATTFLRESPVAVSATAVRRELWRVVRPLPDSAAADMVLFGRLAEMGARFFYIDEPLMIYRVHGANLSAQPSFHTDSIAAWRALSFSEPAAERIRAAREAQALVSRAALRIRTGELGAARRDLAAAKKLRSRQDTRWLLLSAAAHSSSVRRLAVVAHALKGRLLRHGPHTRA